MDGNVCHTELIWSMHSLKSFTKIPLTDLWLNLLGISYRDLHHEIFLRLRYSLGSDDCLPGRLLLHVLYYRFSWTDEVRSQQ
ncbi:hypothetical protein TNCV_2596491 [Trichonephila clavipes]|nr:hypothetical protein TNCV_2596491 [Trichonephila clavipes]